MYLCNDTHDNDELSVARTVDRYPLLVLSFYFITSLQEQLPPTSYMRLVFLDILAPTTHKNSTITLYAQLKLYFRGCQGVFVIIRIVIICFLYRAIRRNKKRGGNLDGFRRY